MDEWIYLAKLAGWQSQTNIIIYKRKSFAFDAIYFKAQVYFRIDRMEGGVDRISHCKFQ